jgi:hypothetical protein
MRARDTTLCNRVTGGVRAGSLSAAPTLVELDHPGSIVATTPVAPSDAEVDHDEWEAAPHLRTPTSAEHRVVPGRIVPIAEQGAILNDRITRVKQHE